MCSTYSQIMKFKIYGYFLVSLFLKERKLQNQRQLWNEYFPIVMRMLAYYAIQELTAFFTAALAYGIYDNEYQVMAND